MLYVILISVMMILLSTKCHQASNLWQHVELTSFLECDLWDTGECNRKYHVDFNAGKTQFVWFDCLNNCCASDMKMNESVLNKKNYLWRCWHCLFFLDWIGTLTRELQPWFLLWSFFPLKLFLIFMNQPYALLWNTVIMSRLTSSKLLLRYLR